jgi:hypothetical protein
MIEMNSPSQFHFDAEELGLLRSVLNEVLNGFEVPDLEKRIGFNRRSLEDLLDRLRRLGDRTGTKLDLDQTRAFRNMLFEAIKELGTEEFQTRTGYGFVQGNDALKKLDRLLDNR